MHVCREVTKLKQMNDNDQQIGPYMSQSQLQGKTHLELVHYLRLFWHEDSICKSIGLA